MKEAEPRRARHKEGEREPRNGHRSGGSTTATPTAAISTRELQNQGSESAAGGGVRLSPPELEGSGKQLEPAQLHSVQKQSQQSRSPDPAAVCPRGVPASDSLHAPPAGATRAKPTVQQLHFLRIPRTSARCRCVHRALLHLPRVRSGSPALSSALTHLFQALTSICCPPSGSVLLLPSWDPALLHFLVHCSSIRLCRTSSGTDRPPLHQPRSCRTSSCTGRLCRTSTTPERSPALRSPSLAFPPGFERVALHSRGSCC
ncbi:hypothetical protein NDU88_006510 [Pleurodeles waltl]|uniref:Uncharacterized protein n=1 Tax=Pleurodeles waltl TaxID=8319 RepID=A0AAV7QP93_PLEWA|nr:hypothetical protein NDU88_006510 [Pleurodeles waltl]